MQNFKNFITSVPFVVSLFAILCSCNQTANIVKSDICGKTFINTINVVSGEADRFETRTLLNCDGTFKSGEFIRDTIEQIVEDSQYSGTWQIETIISNEVKQAVKDYGLNHNNYSIIKYTSSNGISGYCLYYKVASDSYWLGPLDTKQVSEFKFHHVGGSMGIFAGYCE